MIASWQPISNLSHESNGERLDLPRPAWAADCQVWVEGRRGVGGGGVVGCGGGGGGGGGVGGGGWLTAAREIHDGLSQNLVDWLHVQENACSKRY